jgi:hypothetical protein
MSYGLQARAARPEPLEKNRIPAHTVSTGNGSINMIMHIGVAPVVFLLNFSLRLMICIACKKNSRLQRIYHRLREIFAHLWANSTCLTAKL